MTKQFPNNSAEYDYVENATGSKKAAVGVSVLIIGVFIASMAGKRRINPDGTQEYFGHCCKTAW